MSEAYIQLGKSTEKQEKPDDMSWVEWRKYLREQEMDPEELAEREERRKNREAGYPEYKDSWWVDFKKGVARSIPSKTTTGGCCCCMSLFGLLVLIVVLIIVFALVGFYISHGGLFV